MQTSRNGCDVMSMNCDIKNSEALNILDVELELILNMTVNIMTVRPIAPTATEVQVMNIKS